MSGPAPRPVSRTSRLAAVATALALGATLALVTSGGTASARGPDRPPVAGTPEVLLSGLHRPSSLTVRHGDDLYVSQGLPDLDGGTIERLRRGVLTTVARAEFRRPEHLSELAGGVAYTSVQRTRGESEASLVVEDARGSARAISLDVLPDVESRDPGGATYGITTGLTDECAAQFPTEFGELPARYDDGPASPSGTVAHRGEVLVVDAGENDVIAVDRDLRVRLVAVLPGVTLTLTQEAAAALLFPACAVGLDYRFAPVPTDVELGRDGWLYVTSAGAPPVGGLPPTGAVHRVHPRTGEVRPVVGGLSVPADLAIGPRGELYLTERRLDGADRVLVVPRGSTSVHPFLDVAGPVAVEADGRSLYVLTESGDLLRVPIRR